MLLCWSGAGTGPGDAVLLLLCSRCLQGQGRTQGGEKEAKKGLSQVLLMRDTIPGVSGSRVKHRPCPASLQHTERKRVGKLGLEVNKT